MIECALGSIGLLVLTAMTFMACGVALALGIFPQILERRRAHVRAAFLRAQLLHQLSILPQFLHVRDRPLALEHREILDEWCRLAQHAALLEIEEWTSVLRTQALLMTARNRPSFTKRESRVAQQSIDQTASVLRTYASDRLRPGAWWKSILASDNAHSSRFRAEMDHSLKLRNIAR
ncbi:hypothetical protein [Nitrospira sp. Nam74]